MPAGYCTGHADSLAEKSYSKPTTYEELSAYVHQLHLSSKLLNVETIGQSAMGRNLFAMKFSSSKFGKGSIEDKNPPVCSTTWKWTIRKRRRITSRTGLLKPGNLYLFDRIDLVIVPQMNPDGSEINKRLNGNEADLNRNHLTLTEPETVALHHLFDKYLFEVTMDVHEYYPFGDTWRNSDTGIIRMSSLVPLTIRICSENIKDLANQSFLPFLKKYMADRHFTNLYIAPVDLQYKLYPSQYLWYQRWTPEFWNP